MSAFPFTVPLFLPGAALAMMVGVAIAPRLARTLGAHPAVAWLLVTSLITILAATLTPLRSAVDLGATSSGVCDLRRLGPAPLSTYLRPNEVSANVILFMPLGFALALLPRTRSTVILAVLAIALPVVIEGAQLVVRVLARGCQSADVFDNLFGLLLGATAGALIVRLMGGPPGLHR